MNMAKWHAYLTKAEAAELKKLRDRKQKAAIEYRGTQSLLKNRCESRIRRQQERDERNG